MINERVQHVNRIKGLLFAQGISGYEPLRRDRRQRSTNSARAMAAPCRRISGLRSSRELDRSEFCSIKSSGQRGSGTRCLPEQDRGASARREHVARVQGYRRQNSPPSSGPRGFSASSITAAKLASYAGLAPTPWQSGSIDREQGVSKAGNARLRTTLVQLAWLWLRHQPQSALTSWFQERVKRMAAA